MAEDPSRVLSPSVEREGTSFPNVTIPYAFARRFGVVLAPGTDSHFAIAMREGSDPKVLLELRRHLARPFDVGFVTPTEFDRLLSEAYAMDGQAAAMAAGTLGLGDELDVLASDLPTADDLLDTADDAPAIRLINGIIADAARNGVSDIHVEPYETGLVVACGSTACCAKRLGCRRMSRR